MYEIIITHEANKYYKKLDKETKGRVNRAIQIISETPFTGPHIKRLLGEHQGEYRFSLSVVLE